MRSIQNLYTLLTTKEKRNFKLLIIMMFFAMLLETLGIASILPIINLFTNQSNEILLKNKFLKGISEKDLVVFLLVIIFIVYFIKNLFLTFYYYLESRFSYNVRFNLGARLFNHYLSMPYSFHLKEHSSKLITKITQETSLVGSSIMQLSVFITESLIVLGIGLLLMFVRPLETILIITLIIIFSTIFYLLVRKKSQIFGKKLVVSQKFKMKILNESLSSIKEIILFKAKNFFSEKFQKKSNEVSELGYKMSFINRLPKIYFEIFLLIVIISIISLSTYHNKDTLSTIGTLSIFLVSSLKIIPSLNKIIVSLQTIKYSQGAIESLKTDVDNFKKLNIEKNISEKQSENFDKISLKNLSFKHHNKSNLTLENINLDIRKKDFIAVIGKTGSGKTTFINLLTGILEPTSGSILINDEKIIEQHSKLKNLIGYVPQNVFLMDDSIKKNIAFGLDEKNISKSKLDKSIFQAKLSEFLNGLEENHEYVIGENASKVSGGQKQRIAIARALYNDPPILILDEPTSSLDKETADEVIHHLKFLSKTKTIIIVTHKLDNTSIFTKIFEIKDKKIINIKIN